MSTPYDRVPYPCNAYAQTHPAHLAALGILHGMQPAAPSQCRVLEIGCGDGGNLLPLAYTLPQSQFLGIDLAESSIAAGLQQAREFGLPNLDLRALDLTVLSPDDLGQWDYIIAHGVFSWVPEKVRLSLLSLCRSLLAPQGIAFISYNAYPGSQLRHMVREMLLYHTANAPDASSKIAQSQALLQFLAQHTDAADPYGALLKSEAERVLKYDSNHFYHDDLAELNQPFHLHEFADLAGAHGLQYLGDADYASMHALRQPADVQDLLTGLGDDIVRKEQYLDFIKCRRFRQSLLCHAEVPLQRTVSQEGLRSLHFASSAAPVETTASLLDDTLVEFQGEGSLRFRTSHPLAKVTLAYMGMQWPKRIEFYDLEKAVAMALGGAPDPDHLETLLTEFLQLGTAEAHAAPAPFSTHIPERPRASAWALHQLRLNSGGITTLRHHTVQIRDAFGLWLLSQLDGTHTLADLTQAMVANIKPQEGLPLDLDQERREAEPLIQNGLRQLARLGFLLPGA